MARPRKNSRSRKNASLPAKRGIMARYRRLPFLLRAPIALTALCAAALLLAGIVTTIIYSGIARGYDLELVRKMPERSEVVDRNGAVLGLLHGENRLVVPIDKVNPHFLAAILAREDNRFYDHPGIDLIGIARATVRNLKDRSAVQGASTITMQLARNSFGMFQKTLDRKLVEIFISLRIEATYTKAEILEAYVNRIYYGSGIYGVERASQRYFGKPAAEMSLSESALLAGIIRGPNKFSPFRNYEGALSERNTVLKRMVAAGRITAPQSEDAQLEKIVIQPQANTPTTRESSWALDAVRRDLDRILDDSDFDVGGFQIYTTIDAKLQSISEAAIDRRLSDIEKSPGYLHPTKATYKKSQGAPAYLQGALVTVDNDSGAIISIVGGRNFTHSQYNRALLSQRQVGSTFKPFIYAAAMEQGALFPGTLISDGPIRRGELQTPTGNWSPKNSDGKYLGMQPVRTGLIRSRNTMSVRIGDRAGIDNLLDLSHRAGFPATVERTPQLFIGNLGATIKTLTGAFSIFANNGVKKRPYVIDRIVDRDGNLVYESGQQELRVISPGLASMMDDMLQGVMAPGGTGARARSLGFESQAGGKTGTTNDYHDAWFCGYTPRLTCGVWTGLDQPQRIMHRGYGSTLALPIWTDVMKHAEKLGYTRDIPQARAATASIELCNVTAALATQNCRAHGHAYTEDAPYELIPKVFCSLHKGRPAQEAPRAKRRKGQDSQPRTGIGRFFKNLFN